MNFWIRLIGIVLLLAPAGNLMAEAGLPAILVETGENGGETWSLSLQALALMTVLTLLPAFLLMMTSFTRIIIVLGILRTAMGTAQTPSNQILLGLALFLTLFIMQPVFTQVYENAATPYLNEEINAEDALARASAPIKDFMLRQTREDDLKLFLNLSGDSELESTGEVSFFVLMPAFVTSELKTAFQIGFLLFIPFLIIDLVVASVLMSMGMMMLSPLIVSLPFKLMLFVLVDGWTLILGTLAGSFFL
ncbi:MAG TPA: flagellar biosynthesis protein FliP [Chromatiales bacterium]|nr:flagellar type III secretion system pore protein FliP [Thiotrichales bacterium]HIP68525.1 flagellar biosynthesis protein FliP [Chromatiales bacterium]